MENSVVISTPVNATTTAIVSRKMGAVKPLKRNARRCLFGRPDPQVVDQWLTKELDEIRREQQLRWNFLFGPENPCVSTVRDWEFSPVPAESVPQFYRSSYYLSNRCTPCEVENCIPCSSNISNNCSLDSTATSVTSDCSDAEMPVLPTTTASGLSKRKGRLIAKKQTKLTAFMNVDSRKRLRQQTKKAPSSPKSIRLIGHCRSFI
uniref:Cyclin-dependent kinase inhibitor domain-containing protein n=1 Tax=Setaria digitata TaxID=48799 RepID=A0A915PN67_9BILA